MDPKVGLIAGAALTLLVLACILFKPALADTDVRTTTGVRLTADAAGKEFAAHAMAPADVAAGLIDFASSQVQAAIDSEKARYSAVYTGQFVIADFWNGKAPRYATLTAQRLTPDEVASTFIIALEPTSDATPSKLLVRPRVATIERAMAKLLERSLVNPITWFKDTTTLLNVDVTWKVEDLSGSSDKVSEASIEIAGYDMTALDGDRHRNYFRGTGGPPSAVGVLDFPHADNSPGLYRVTVTVTEKDPLNADSSVEAEKTLAKDVIEAVKKLISSAKL